MTYKEKLKSLSFRPTTPGPKVTNDELGNTTTEHWNDRVDVVIRPQVGKKEKEND